MKPINIDKGVTFTILHKKDDDGNIIQPLTEIDTAEYYEKLIKLNLDFGLCVDKYGDIDKMENNLCKTKRKEWERASFDRGVERGIMAVNRANKFDTPIVKPEFHHDDL